jgi:hypothetical protein
VRKATVMDAVEGSFGGPKSALPAHKNNAFNSWTSAYMLVGEHQKEGLFHSYFKEARGNCGVKSLTSKTYRCHDFCVFP